MSRAFVKEPDGAAPEALPLRRISKASDYVTRLAGLESLDAEYETLMARRAELFSRSGHDANEELRRVDRDLTYVKARIGSAILVDPAEQPADKVAFGAIVTVRERSESTGVAGSRSYTMVGEDEAARGSQGVS